MKKTLALILALALSLSLAACGSNSSTSTEEAGAAGTSSAANTTSDNSANDEVMKVGFVYIGDESEAYTANFIQAQTAIEETFGDQVQAIAKYNVEENSSCYDALVELCEQGCSVIFATSFGFEDFVMEVAKEYPEVEFCHASGYQCAASEMPNVHNYFAEIYQGRYLTGIVAGMKLQEMIDDGIITADQAKLGYVGAYAYAEVISGYTAFYLGAHSIVPSATMEVTYVNSWGDYESEYQAALSLIADGCVIISQHSDTYGPSAACETAENVYHVGYNQNMISNAPTSSLVSSRILWTPYEVGVVQSVMDGTEIPKDSWGGLAEGWVELTELNADIVAEGTEDAITAGIDSIVNGGNIVFQGDFTGTNYEGNTLDLNNGYIENESSSAPSYDYVLDGVTTVIG